MPSNDSRRRPGPAPEPDAESSVWRDEGLDAFVIHEHDRRADASRPKVEADLLAEFELSPRDEALSASPPVPYASRTRSVAAHVAAACFSLLCLAGAAAIALGYLWPDVSSDVATRHEDETTPSTSGRPAEDRSRNARESAAAPGAQTDAERSAPSADDVSRGDAVRPRDEEAPRDVPRPLAEPRATRVQVYAEMPLEPSEPDAALAAAPIDTWSALSAPSAPASAEAETTTADPESGTEEAAIVDRTAIERLLHAYEEAYDRRDVAAVAALWPSMDAAGFSRAFASVKQQDLRFDACTTTLDGDRAVVECPGEIRFVRQVGGDAPQTRRAMWTIHVVRTVDRWQVQLVTVR